MWWIIGIVIVIAIIGGLAESNDLSSKIMLFSGFLLILGFITSGLFEFMSVVTELSGFVLIASLVFKVFRKIFVN